eukprot:gene10080-21011_t
MAVSLNHMFAEQGHVFPALGQLIFSCWVVSTQNNLLTTEFSMSDSLKKFLEENAEAAIEPNDTVKSKIEDIAIPPSEGELVITACVDWMNATSKSAVGLDMPHLIQFKTPVHRVFSSSNSVYFFVLLADRKTLLAIGRNDHGQLGTRNTENQFWPTPVPFTSTSNIKKISTGKSHSMLLLENGEMYVCGANNCGQIGLGDGARALQDVTSFTKLNIDNVCDIACGWEHSLVCTDSGDLYAFGHPDYGQLGFGSNGQFIRDGGKKGPAIQFHYVTKPQKVQKFFTKDLSKKILAEIPKNTVKVVRVAAGKNHSLCVEDWENGGQNRVFSWGFGGYGRLGHNCSDDEMYPAEIAVFSQQKALPFKQIREVYAGSTASIAISVSRHVYFFGKLPNSPRGEASIYPKIQQELYDWSVHSVGVGSTSVMVAAAKDVVVWGAPIAGKFGAVGGGKNCTNPNFVESLKGFDTLQVSCGYGHCCMVVNTANLDDEHRRRWDAMPVFTKDMALAMVAQNEGGDDDDDGEEPSATAAAGKKRGRQAGASAASKKGATTANKKKK